MSRTYIHFSVFINLRRKVFTTNDNNQVQQNDK